jgi:hypothetical protein
MRRAVYAFLILAVLFPSLPGEGATWIVPGLSNAPGRNETFFTSDLKLRNPGSATAEVTFELMPYVGSAVQPATRTIVAGETLVLPNAIKDLWGEGDRAGSARVTSTQNLLISARTFNSADPTGTFGLALEAIPEEKLLTAGQTGHIGWVSESADSSVGFRTNIGVVLAQADSSLEAVVFGTTGKELGRRTFSGGPLVTQVSIRDVAGADVSELSVARLELRVTAGKATGYSAVVDNVTGDGFAVQPERITPGSWADVFLDGASRGAGRFETFFRTDVRLVNPDPVARRVTVSGVSLVVDGALLPASVTIDVPARAVLEASDILQMLGAPEGTSGSLRFETDGPLLVLGRTSNVRSDGATFGALQKTLEPAQYLSKGRVGVFIGLTQSSAAPGFRTNIGFLSGPAGAIVDLTLRDRAGTVVTTRAGAVVLGAYAFFQPSLADLFPGTSIPENATLEVMPADGTVDVYASVIDNGTGDPVIYTFKLPAASLPGNVADTSPCAPKEGVAGGINPGTNLSRVEIDTNRYPEAVCNDGSPGLFYVRKGTGASANRWLIFLEGGGSCMEGTGCAKRWCSIDTNFGADKMSTRFFTAKGIGGGGILATRDDSVFTDFNKVWVYYCSSDAWVGRYGERPLVDETGRTYTIHFQGGRILDAVLTELRSGVTFRDAGSDQQVTLPSLDDAEAILFAGESAGSAGVQRNADRLEPYFRRTNRNPGRLVYRALGDAANEPSNESFSLYETSKRSAMRGFGVVLAARFDESCLARHRDDSWRCADAAHVRENHITTPLFVRQDLIDPNTIDEFGTPEWPFGIQLHQYAQATWDHLDAISRVRMTGEEKSAIAIDPGVYGPHCDNHTAARDNGKFFQDRIAKGDSLFSFHDTLRNWLISTGPSVVLQARPTEEPAPKSAVCTPQ